MFKHLKTQQISGVPIKVWFSNQILSLKDIISIKIVGFPNLFCRISAKMKFVEFSVKHLNYRFKTVNGNKGWLFKNQGRRILHIGYFYLFSKTILAAAKSSKA
ncbi:MAG: hypothetical protein ACI9XO_001791 [Paraglaciecola sp.]|jgi:hypothetical protein